MVKLTVMYNLPEGADHEEFLRWRLGEHQQNNAAAPGLIKTDFYIARATHLGEPRYRYITEAYFESMADIEQGFLSDEGQAALQTHLGRIHEPVFLISEEAVTTVIKEESR